MVLEPTPSGLGSCSDKAHCAVIAALRNCRVSTLQLHITEA